MPGPLYHNGPFVTAFPALMVGAHVVVMPKFDRRRDAAADREASRDLGLSRADDDEPHLAPAGRGAREIRPVVAEDALAPRGALPAMAEGGMDQLAGPGRDLGALWRHRRRCRHHHQRREWLAHRGSVGKSCSAARWRRFRPDGNDAAARRDRRDLHAAEAGAARRPIAISARRRARCEAAGNPSATSAGWTRRAISISPTGAPT